MPNYVDRLFASYKKSSPRLTEHMTKKEDWLDGEHGWRSPLREIGEYAARVCKIKDIKAARNEWAAIAYNNIMWIRQYLHSVPLLENTVRQADHDDKVFRQFMKDLATLAKL